MKVKVGNLTMQTRTVNEATTMAAGDIIGVTLRKQADENQPYSSHGYDNIPYTYTNGTEWTTTENPLLTATEGQAAAYFPYDKDHADVKAIPVTTESQTDYLYSGWVKGLSMANSEASFTMKHALSVVRVIIKKTEDHTADATLSAISVKSPAFFASATLDATTGVLSDRKGQGTDLALTDLTQALSTSGTTYDFLVVPGTDVAGIRFKLTINGEDFSVTADNVTLQQSCIHTFTMAFSRQDKDLTLSTQSVTPWGENQKVALGLNYVDP